MLQRTIFDQLLQRTKIDRVTINYWDGRKVTYGKTGRHIGTLTIHDPAVLDAITKNIDLGFGEAYMDGRVEFDGDIHDLIIFGLENKDLFPDLQGVKAISGILRGFNKATSVKEQRADIHHHYDLGNDFFKLFLDPTMTYSAAYFRTKEDTLEQAQHQKVSHTLKKLNLEEGEKLLDIGSGWGQMILEAAETYGVTAHGITMSDQQVAETQRRIKESQVADKISVALEDYRNHAKKHVGAYDKIVSVGMFEHVGRPNLPIFMAAVANMLKPGGLLLLHFITKPKEEVGSSFTLRYIFPGGYIPSVRETVSLFAEEGLHLLDVENLRLHYAMTLDHWAKNFDHHLDKVRALFKEEKFTERWQGDADVDRFIRMWHLYLRGSAAGFRAGTIELHQFLVSKGINNTLPLTRENWYK